MLVKSYRDLEVWQRTFEAGMEIFSVSKSFPRDEAYPLTDQIRRSSRSVSANVAEAWESRRYEALFISKLTLAAGEVAETQNWLDHAMGCQYLRADDGLELRDGYDRIRRTIHSMIAHSSKWCVAVPASDRSP
ncbi:MAG TPA: four helix bundle protein [Fimbriimonadaceae bacterium]|nr:four helix bundle protein [Fimbriimonadaceae bacterium]